MAALVGLGRKTVTNVLVTAGLQALDWTASYRLFSKERVDPQALFAVVARHIHAQLPADVPFVVAIDDTGLRKSGRKIYGAGYRRDPLGPKFRVNLVWAQRFIQLAVALPLGTGSVGARTIPLDFWHAPLPKKPGKNASEQEQADYVEQRRAANLSNVALERIVHMRARLDDLPGGKQRMVWIQGDGGYTNATILKGLPERTIYTGRVRKDAKLFHLPEANKRGRARVYGAKASTPDKVREDSAIPWQEVEIYAAGTVHTMRVKTVAPLRSPISGKANLRLIVIAPLGYRLRKNSKILYRQPAYLVCTDLDRTLQEIVQAYVWRWEIEVNHRDEKNILGVGQAQVRTKGAASRVPAFIVASYSMALLAAHQFIQQRPLDDPLPRPKWNKQGNPKRPPFQHILQCLRAEIWAKALNLQSFNGFATRPEAGMNPKKIKEALPNAILSVSN